MSKVGTGKGTTAILNTQSIAAPLCITGMSTAEWSSPPLEKICLESDNVEKIPGDIFDANSLTVNFLVDPDHLPDLDDAGLLTIVLPLRAGQSQAASLAGTGFITEINRGELALNTLVAGSLTWTWDGDTGPAFTAAS